MDEGKDTKNDENNEYKIYLEERKILIDAERDTAQQFDKAILTLAAGALALSITFINQIAPEPEPNSICYLITAWSLFALSILSTLISFLSSQAACRQSRDVLDQQISGITSSKKTSAHTVTNILNYFSIGSFILGVIFLVIFSSINLLREVEVMSNKGEDIAGFVPQRPPIKKPTDKTDKAHFVSQKLAVRPPQNPKGEK